MAAWKPTVDADAVARIRAFERELTSLCKRYSVSMELDGLDRVCLVDHKRPPFPGSDTSWPWVAYFDKADEFGLSRQGVSGLQLENYAGYED